MSEALPKHADDVVLWTNTVDNNNHSLVLRPDGVMVLTIVKPGEKPFIMESGHTISTPAEWQAACAGLGPKWHQDEGSEIIDGPRYQAVRRAKTEKEEAVWTVDHTKIVRQNIEDAQYLIADQFKILLREQVA